MNRLLAALLIVTATAQADAAVIRISGLAMELDDKGSIASLSAGSCNFAASGGLFVREAPKGPLLPVALGNSSDRQTLLATDGLTITARIETQSDRFEVTGVVEDNRRSSDRGVDVVFRLPFAPATWWAGISREIPPGAEQRLEPPGNATELAEGAAALDKIEDGNRAQNFLPLACVTDPGGRAGLALALPPDAPCRLRFASTAETGGIELQLFFGLSQAAPPALKGRAPFRFLIFPADGRWGLRDALQRYYSMFPAGFQRRTRASGMWLVSMPSLKEVRDPTNYAFWQATRLGEIKTAQALGLETYPYTIVGQREICHLKDKPITYDDVLAALARKPESTRKARYSWEEVQPIVSSSGLFDATGRRIHRIRHTDWGGDSVSFPVNPSPYLPADVCHPTAASHTFAEIGRVLKDHPDINGVFVDSLGMWGSYENYQRDHFAAIRAPLSHDAAGRVCLPNWLPHVDYLQELHRRIGARLIFANGLRPGRAFCAFDCDICGMEVSLQDLESRRDMDFLRSMAGPKPALCLLNYPDEMTRERTEHYIQRFVALGFAPEMRRVPWGRYSERDSDLYARFLPIYRRLDLAGWQPVTHAIASPVGIWVERFGTRPPDLYFALYNPNENTALADLAINRQALSLTGETTLREIIENSEMLEPRQLLELPPLSLRVVQVMN